MFKMIMLPLMAVAGATALPMPASAQEDTLAKARAAGTIVMGVRESSAPLSYLLGSSKYTGYHVELCEAVLARLLPQVKISYQVVTSQNRMPLVQNGSVDIECGSTSNTAARKQQVAFALTTYITEARFAVKASSGIERAEQLQGKTVATTTGTTLVQRLRKLEKKGLNFNLVYGKDHADSFLLLASGRADAFAMDDNTLAGNIANAASPKDFKIVGEPLGVEPIAIMLRRGDDKFKQAVDGEIRKAMASGELERLYNKWFVQSIPPAGTAIGLPFRSEQSLPSASWTHVRQIPIGLDECSLGRCVLRIAHWILQLRINDAAHTSGHVGKQLGVQRVAVPGASTDGGWQCLFELGGGQHLQAGRQVGRSCWADTGLALGPVVAHGHRLAGGVESQVAGHVQLHIALALEHE